MQLIVMNSIRTILRIAGNNAAYWAAPVLLSALALTQSGESTLGTLTRWKGGGFGMFSTIDSIDSRFVKAYVLSDEGETPVSIPSDFSTDEVQIQTWPRESRLRDLANKMAKLSWFVTPTTRPTLLTESDRSLFPDLRIAANRPKVIAPATRPDQYSGKYSRMNVTGVRLEVWKLRMDSNGTSLGSQCLASATSDSQASERN
jgi:hypothetical protein